MKKSARTTVIDPLGLARLLLRVAIYDARLAGTAGVARQAGRAHMLVAGQDAQTHQDLGVAAVRLGVHLPQ